MLIGKPGADIIRIAGVSDEQILVDRVKLRDGPKLSSIHSIIKLMRQIRGLRFDFVIDLHSLYETNILGFLSGAKHRLYGNRGNRSLDRLGRFPTLPPKEDRSKHHVDRYFDVLRPLGISGFDGKFRIEAPDGNKEEIDKLWIDLGIADKRRVGIFIGAGNPSRCWDLGKFAELAQRFVTVADLAVLVFLGPEEKHIAGSVRSAFPAEAIILDELKLIPLMAASATLDVLVSNDTGPMHLAASVGAPIVLIQDKRAPDVFDPISPHALVLRDHTIAELPVDQVFDAAMVMLTGTSK